MSRSHKKILVIMTICFSGTLICCIGSLYQILYWHCWLWTCTPSRTFSVFDLSLPNHLFPENATINPMLPPSEPGGVESGSIMFHWLEFGTTYGGTFNIDRYGTEERAKAYFESILYWRSRDSYKTNPTITYISPTADEFLISCGTSMFGGGYECSWAARYQEFIVTFTSSISGQMSESQFEKVVVDIDQQMTSYLGQED